MGIAIRHFVRSTALLAVMVGGCPVMAGPSISEKATARALFDEARALVEGGNIEQACPKFKESYQLDPGSGSAFHLADCYERTGKIASAWALYLEVAVLTRNSGEKHKEEAARRRAANLEPRISRLNIAVPEQHAIDGMQVKRNGKLIAPASWNTALPVDPGDHQITVEAPGRQTWTTKVTIKGEGSHETVAVPALAVEASPTESPALPGTTTVASPAVAVETNPTEPPALQGTTEQDSHASSGFNSQGTVGMLVAGGGLLTFGVGTFLGFRAKSSYHDSDPYCNDDLCSQQGLDIRSDARSDAKVATIVGGVGLAAMVGGAVLYFTASDDVDSESVRTAFGLGPGSLMVRGVW
ncbi:MAG: hypothetical protein CSA75_03795 [Sorangium cellulosum]|nr:MAG: hypothetical protein CSA75_03795 [Sorangium cellulosum]